ncbi:hypothetical protein [Allosphingosinicella deserti]|uniref:Uncharacterized protein n=1 Tax=Allosphingosinicella deserti TaxID=2116704 RepID=A0A2P7QED5_9SPHN|nr:hypothetical protein [Sphingomonas deserti]PSJ36329.1 hypothetical protein C7I55_26950 [Sphingomonas deserti]
MINPALPKTAATTPAKLHHVLGHDLSEESEGTGFACKGKFMALSPSTQIADAEYLLRRAEAEAVQANTSTSRAAEVHHKLASAYLDQLFGDSASGPAGAQRPAETAAALRSIFADWPLPNDSDDSFEEVVSGLAQA